MPDDEAVCSNGVDGVESVDGTICCSSECDECSEDACSLSLSFGSDGDSECCSSDVANAGELCDSTGVSPCIISEGIHASLGLGKICENVRNNYYDYGDSRKATVNPN